MRRRDGGAEDGRGGRGGRGGRAAGRPGGAGTDRTGTHGGGTDTVRGREVRTVPTPAGDARIEFAAADRPRAVLVLGHGAGGGIGARDLAALAAVLPGRGITVALVEQPWRVAGKRLAPAPKTLDTAWTAVWEALEAQGPPPRHPGTPAPRSSRSSDPSHQYRGSRPGGVPGLPVIAGGRSAGARVACRTGAALGAAAVLALSFPLHPPGRPERSRADELLGTGLPTLVVQGDRDAFGVPAEFTGAGYAGELVPVASGDHGFAVPKRADTTEEEAMRTITDAVAAWLDRLLAGGPVR